MERFRRLDFNIKGVEGIQEKTAVGGLGELIHHITRASGLVLPLDLTIQARTNTCGLPSSRCSCCGG